METVKDKIYSLFNQAFDFAENTPSTEFQKYLEYSKDFATSFNRLIKDVKDPIEQNEIIDFCITKDDLLLIHLVVEGMPHPKEYALKRNYGALKELFLNRLELPDAQLEPVKKKVFSDFLHNIEDKEGFIVSFRAAFSGTKGKPLKALLTVMKDAEIIVWGHREFKTLYDSMVLEFAWYIGTYPSINDAKITPGDTDPWELRLKPLKVFIKKN